MDLPVDALVADRYRITDRLGRGGMAVVYGAHDEVLDRPVAVKVLADHLLDDDRSLDRFEREARAAAGLNHPNVVAVHDASSDGDTHFLVMERVQGESLAQRLKASGPMGVDESLALGDSVAAALAAAHGRQIVHRDVKPSNILLTDDGQVKVTDFGIARAVAAAATQTAVVMGSVPYIAPEQLDGRSGADPRSDLYALGCVLYECLTGRPPFVSDTSAAVLGQHLHLPAPRVSDHRPGVGDPVDELLASLLAKDPDDRPPSAADLRQRIARVRAGQPPVPPGSGPGAGAAVAGAAGSAGVLGAAAAGAAGAAAAAAAAGARGAGADAPTEVVDQDQMATEVVDQELMPTEVVDHDQMATEVVDQDMMPTEVVRADDADGADGAAAGGVAGAVAGGAAAAMAGGLAGAMGDDPTARMDESVEANEVDETMRLDQTMRLDEQDDVDAAGMGLPPGAGPTDGRARRWLVVALVVLVLGLTAWGVANWLGGDPTVPTQTATPTVSEPVATTAPQTQAPEPEPTSVPTSEPQVVPSPTPSPTPTPTPTPAPTTAPPATTPPTAVPTTASNAAIASARALLVRAESTGQVTPEASTSIGDGITRVADILATQDADRTTRAAAEVDNVRDEIDAQVAAGNVVPGMANQLNSALDDLAATIP